MRFKSKQFKRELREQKLIHWHKWFAWYWVKLGRADGFVEWAWLETVYRKGVIVGADCPDVSYWSWRYKEH